jgi:acyl-CoA synthetase (AMP-forming)/AMP-acid ligase II
MTAAALPHVYPTVVHMLQAGAEAAPDRIALRGGGDALTYREYLACVGGVVVLRKGSDCAPDDLLEHTRERLTRYKVPSTLAIVPSLPKTGVGKIDKLALRAWAKPSSFSDADERLALRKCKHCSCPIG